MQRNSELRRDLASIAELAEALKTLAGLAPPDALEPGMAGLVLMTRTAYEGLIDRTVLDGVRPSARDLIEDAEDAESRRLASSCGGRQ